MIPEQLDELSVMLNRHFHWNKAKMGCFVGLLCALFVTRSINLIGLAEAFPSQVKLKSRYRRIQRFIHETPICYRQVAFFIMKLFGFLNSDYYLAMDRTNWQWGKANINILVLAVVYRGAAIPVCWILLNKKGNSNYRERIALVKRFVSQFGKQHLLGILADREFVGTAWFDYLKTEKINFVIRIKKNTKTTNSHGKAVQVQNLFLLIKRGESLALPKPRCVMGTLVYLSALRLDDGQLLIVASTVQGSQVIEIYGKRWEIEIAFGNLKGRGFHFEDTHIVQRTRLKRLLVVAVIAFAWAVRIGEWRHDEIEKIKVKKHLRLEKSIFRVGLDLMRETLFKGIYSFKSEFEKLIQFVDFNCFLLKT